MRARLCGSPRPWPRRIALLTVLLLLVPIQARAADAPLPDTAYPSGVHIQYLPSLTNAQVDCQWGFNCDCGAHGCVPNEASPLFHTETQNALHRVAGWAIFASTTSGPLMTFTLFVSRYADGGDQHGQTWAARAYYDVNFAAWLAGYRAVRVQPELTPGDDAILGVWHSGVSDALLIACRHGQTEIEGVATFPASRGAARIARKYLVRQVRALDAWTSARSPGLQG